MRLFKLFSWMLLCGMVVAFMPLASAQAQPGGGRVQGRINVAKVTGTVTAVRGNDSPVTLKIGDVLAQDHTVTTSSGSSVILVFDNGATLNLGAESTLRIEEFLIDPFSTSVSVSDLTEEPTTSVTRLHLSRGELVGNVKHLKQDQGSSFVIDTPVGAAGIRGTTFRIVFRPDASGRVFFTLSTAEGAVLFTGQNTTAAPVPVETGKEVVVSVEVNVDPVTSTVTVTAPPVIDTATDMPPQTRTAIEAATTEAVIASSSVILSNTSAVRPDDTSKESTTKEGPKDGETETNTDSSKTGTGKSDDNGNGTSSSGNNGRFNPQNNNTPAPLPASNKPTPTEGL
jgi:hypothetical protein